MTVPLADTFVSVVVLPGAGPTGSDRLARLHELLASRYENFEVVIVDASPGAAAAGGDAALVERFECVRTISLSRPVGDETALLAGLDSAIGDVVVTMEIETDPPAAIPGLVERCRGGVDVLYGIAHHTEPAPLGYRLVSAVFRAVASRLRETPVGPTPTRFRCFSRAAVNALTRIRHRQRNFAVLLDEIGFRNEPFEYNPEAALREREYYRLSGSAKRAVEFLVADSIKPLRFAGLLGICGSGLSLLYALYVVVVNFLKREVMEGWTTLSLQASGMFLLLFIILTVLVEYLGRLLEEIGTRPLYHVREEHQSRSMLAHEKRRNVYEDSTEDDGGR